MESGLSFKVITKSCFSVQISICTSKTTHGYYDIGQVLKEQYNLEI